MKKILLLLLLLNFSLIYSQTIITTVNNVTCNGNNDGTIMATATGGTTPYTYFLMNGGGTILSGPSTIGAFFGLSSGVYTVMVVDALGSTASSLGVVTEPTPILYSATVSGNSVSAFTSGGTPPYFYSINMMTYQTNNTFLSLPAGTYTMYVKDIQGCISTQSFTIPVLSNATSKFDNYNFSFNSNTSLFSFSNNSTIEDLTVYSILGEKVISKKIDLSSSQLDLSSLSKGIYLVKFSAENQEKTIKIIRN